MGKLRQIVKLELREKVSERVLKSKRHDYVHGGFKVEETIHRVTAATYYALLDCGHWRKDYNGGKDFRKMTKMACFECEKNES